MFREGGVFMRGARLLPRGFYANIKDQAEDPRHPYQDVARSSALSMSYSWWRCC